MPYHETFWVAVAATAPVIALANTVSVGDSLKLLDPDRQGKQLVSDFDIVAWPCYLSFISMTAQLIFLFNALYSIAKRL